MSTSAPVYNLAEFKALLPATGRLIGLDVGTKTIGVAVSDATRMIASPDLTIMRKKWSEDASALQAMIDGEQIVGMVLGYPVNMDGTPGPRAQATRAFARMFQERMPMPVLLWDERMSTMAVNRMMIDELDINRKRRAELVDKLAASYILQGVLDGLTQPSH
jgi:putative Holliday junction resolvase